MPTEYRLSLERKLDGVRNLERSGYGATYGKAKRAEDRATHYETVRILTALAVGMVALTVVHRAVLATLAVYGI